MTTQTRQSIESKIIARAWKDEQFKQKLMSNPDAAKAELEKEMGKKLPAGFNVQVYQETENTAYLVIPPSPENTKDLSDEHLESVASGGNTIVMGCNLGSFCPFSGPVTC
jgi:hypothetical protein